MYQMVHSEGGKKEVVVGQQEIDDEVTTKGTPEAVFKLLIDGSTWPQWSPIDSFELVKPGLGTPEGVGAVRIFRTGRTTSTERVSMVEPNVMFSYVLVSGLPLRDYKAVVTLEPRDGVTVIHWRSTFRAKIPGSGWLYRRQLSLFIGHLLNGLALEAAASVLG
jgi:hypothetical protein